MNFPNKQQGMSFSGWLLVIVVIGGMVSLGANLAPLYFDFSTIGAVLESMEREPGLNDKSEGELKALILKRLTMNNIRDFDIGHKMVIKKDSDRTNIDMQYESRVPLFGNLELVAKFEKHVLLRD